MDITMLVVQGRPKGKCLRLSVGEFLIGRGDECHIRPNSPWVSRQHCMLRISEASTSVQDLGSTNGTLINGVRLIGEQVLAPGDRLQIGPLVLQFVEKPMLAADPSQVFSQTADNLADTRSDFCADQFLQDG